MKWFKLGRWDEKLSDIREYEVIRTTDKSVWFLLKNGRENREILNSKYHKWFDSYEKAEQEILARQKRASDSQDKKRLSEAAPALLEALQNLSAAYDMLCNAVDENPESNKYYMAEIDAIALAKGK